MRIYIITLLFLIFFGLAMADEPTKFQKISYDSYDILGSAKMENDNGSYNVIYVTTLNPKYGVIVLIEARKDIEVAFKKIRSRNLSQCKRKSPAEKVKLTEEMLPYLTQTLRQLDMAEYVLQGRDDVPADFYEKSKSLRLMQRFILENKENDFFGCAIE